MKLYIAITLKLSSGTQRKGIIILEAPSAAVSQMGCELLDSSDRWKGESSRRRRRKAELFCRLRDAAASVLSIRTSSSPTLAEPPSVVWQDLMTARPKKLKTHKETDWNNRVAAKVEEKNRAKGEKGGSGWRDGTSSWWGSSEKRERKRIHDPPLRDATTH